jgi:hypothetical protein
MGTVVLSDGGGVAELVVFVRNAGFCARLWRLCEMCVCSGVGG